MLHATVQNIICIPKQNSKGDYHKLRKMQTSVCLELCHVLYGIPHIRKEESRTRERKRKTGVLILLSQSYTELFIYFNIVFNRCNNLFNLFEPFVDTGILPSVYRWNHKEETCL